MHVIYCDGSSKKTDVVVVGIVVAKVNAKYTDRIQEVVYVHKNRFNIPYQENSHEILAYLEALEVMRFLHLEDEIILIVNDSVADTLVMNSFKQNRQLFDIKTSNPIILEKLEKIKSLELKNIYFQRLPRTTLGINIADFLNEEENKWINPDIAKFLATQIKKMSNRPIDFDISPKSRALNK